MILRGLDGSSVSITVELDLDFAHDSFAPNIRSILPVLDSKLSAAVSRIPAIAYAAFDLDGQPRRLLKTTLYFHRCRRLGI